MLKHKQDQYQWKHGTIHAEIVHEKLLLSTMHPKNTKLTYYWYECYQCAIKQYRSQKCEDDNKQFSTTGFFPDLITT